jgi:hypothetical protein
MENIYTSTHLHWLLPPHSINLLLGTFPHFNRFISQRLLDSTDLHLLQHSAFQLPGLKHLPVAAIAIHFEHLFAQNYPLLAVAVHSCSQRSVLVAGFTHLFIKFNPDHTRTD